MKHLSTPHATPQVAVTRRLNKELGTSIGHWRDARGFRLEETARAVRINPSRLAEIEAGKRTLTLGMLISISRAIGVAPAHILAGVDVLNEVPR